MKTFTGVVCHTDSDGLTYHDSVTFLPEVPLVLDFNDLNRIGRAKITRTDTQIIADLFLDHDIEVEGDDAPTAMCATQDSVVFESENGTHYVMGGSLQQITLLSETALKEITEGTFEPTVEELGMADNEDAA